MKSWEIGYENSKALRAVESDLKNDFHKILFLKHRLTVQDSKSFHIFRIALRDFHLKLRVVRSLFLVDVEMPEILLILFVNI